MILLDTPVVFWSMVDPDRLGPQARALISASTTRFVSSITHVELAVQQAKGTIHLPADLPERLSAAGFEGLAFTDQHALGLQALPALVDHDPFDRMLLAQAQVAGLTFLTSDRHLLDLDGTVDATR